MTSHHQFLAREEEYMVWLETAQFVCCSFFGVFAFYFPFGLISHLDTRHFCLLVCLFFCSGSLISPSRIFVSCINYIFGSSLIHVCMIVFISYFSSLFHHHLALSFPSSAEPSPQGRNSAEIRQSLDHPGVVSREFPAVL